MSPRRARRRAAWALVVAATAVSCRPGPPRTPLAASCRDPGLELRGLWDAQRRSAIDRRARAVAPAHLRHLAAQLADGLDALRDEWAALRRRDCSFARGLDPSITRSEMRSRTTCASASLAIDAALLDALEAADAAAIAGSPAALASVARAHVACARREPQDLDAWIAIERAAVRSLLGPDEDAVLPFLALDKPDSNDTRPVRVRATLVAEAALRGGDLELAAAELTAAERVATPDDLDATLLTLRLRLALARVDNATAEALARRLLDDLRPPRRSPRDRAPIPYAAHALRRVGDLAAARELLAYAGGLDETTRLDAELLAERGRVEITSGAPSAAIVPLSAALERRVALDGPEHPETARVLHLLGAAYEATARLDVARLYYERALGIRVRALGDDAETADTYNNLGNLAFRAGDYEEAAARHAAARRIRVERFGEDHPATATSDNNLGMLLLARGDAEAALARFTRVLAIRRRTLGEEHPNTAIAHNNAGLARAALGDVEGALAEHLRALAVRRAFFGEEHLETARSHHNVGALLLDRGDLVGARPHLDQALHTRREHLPPEHPEVRGSAALVERLRRASRPLDDAGWSL